MKKASQKRKVVKWKTCELHRKKNIQMFSKNKYFCSSEIWSGFCAKNFMTKKSISKKDQYDQNLEIDWKLNSKKSDLRFFQESWTAKIFWKTIGFHKRNSTRRRFHWDPVDNEIDSRNLQQSFV
jgi:hypothetical protein